MLRSPNSRLSDRISIMKCFLALVMIIFSLAACKQIVSPTGAAIIGATTPPQEPTITQPGIEASITPAPSSTPTPAPENTTYTIKVNFNYGLHNLAVDQAVVYTNNTPETLNDLVMMVEPNNNSGVFRLKEFTWSDGQAVRDYSLDANILRITLPQPLAPYQKLKIHLTYDLQLPAIPAPADDRRPVPFGYTDHQVNLVDWYPSIPPYVPGTGWLAHKPWFYGEHQVYEMADFTVEVQLVNPPSGLVLAASAPAVQDAASEYSYIHRNARNFVWSASPYYKLFTQKVGDIEILSYAFTFDTVAGKGALQYTAQALELYGKLFTPYQHPSMTVVEADFLDGMEYDGLYFLSRGFYNLYGGNPQSYLAAIAAHETAHQWWYAQVMDDQALEPWLDESMATYCEYIFYKNIYPDYLKWWWDYRVDYYEPMGKINLQLYDYTSYRAYRDAVYLNGAHFLDDLRTLIGDDAFFAFLQDYAKTFQNRLTNRTGFFNVLQMHTNKDFSGLISKYFN